MKSQRAGGLSLSTYFKKEKEKKEKKKFPVFVAATPYPAA